MATFQSTTTKELIADIAQHIKDEIKPTGKLPSIRKVATEPVANPAMFPIITVIPITENAQGYHGNKLYNIRRVRIEVLTQKRDGKSALRQNIGIVEQVKNIFKVNAADYQIPDRVETAITTVADLVIVDVETGGQTSPFKNGFLQVGAIEVEAHSYDTVITHDLVPSTSRSLTVTPTDTKTLIDKITGFLKAAKLSSAILSEVRSLKSFTLPPQPVYPVVFVAIEEERRDHKFAGQDSVDRTVSITILTKIKSKTKSLNRSMDLADKCRQIIMAYPDIDGTCYDVAYVGTNYGQLTARGDLLFGTQVLFNTSSYEGLPTS
jgi:hypothetical protein